MDEQEMIRFLRSELYQAMERDPELRAALKHIDAGKGTFQDTAQYSERTSELLGQILSKHVDELPEGMRETVCKALLRERYEEVNGICAEVQEQLDAQNGIRLQPQRASYPAERVQQVAHALDEVALAAQREADVGQVDGRVHARALVDVDDAAQRAQRAVGVHRQHQRVRAVEQRAGAAGVGRKGGHAPPQVLHSDHLPSVWGWAAAAVATARCASTRWSRRPTDSSYMSLLIDE